MFFFERPKWKTVEYSRSKIIRAGKTIKDISSTEDQLKEATAIIDNWRAAHAYPLHVIYNHLRRMANNRPNIIVAERLKRLDSIINKLKREPTMSLWTMQDLGGCRYIVPEIRDVYDSAKRYESSRKRHMKVNEYDYISAPKSSGYRSYHVVYEYKSDANETYNKNMMIEIQFRTHLQHIWATAVETMGLFTKQAIKSGQGTDDVKRFFSLVSSLFAIKENCPTVPGTPTDIKEIISEIKEINSRCNYIDMLSAIRVAVEDQDSKHFQQQGYYILILNYNVRMLRVKHFKPSQLETATEIYQNIERTRAESKIDAVLVRVDSFKTLKSAYPNYFSDIGEFIDLVKSYLT